MLWGVAELRQALRTELHVHERYTVKEPGIQIGVMNQARYVKVQIIRTVWYATVM